MLVGRITRTWPFSIRQITEWKKAKSSQCCHEEMSEEVFFSTQLSCFFLRTAALQLSAEISFPPTPTVSALCRHLPETNGLTRRPDPTQLTQPTDFSFQESPSRPVGWGPTGNRPHEKQLIPARAWERKDERPLFPLQQKEVGREKMEEEETKETNLTRRTLAGSKGVEPGRGGL